MGGYSKLILKAMPVPVNEEERAENIIKFKIITPRDKENAVNYYRENVTGNPLEVTVTKWRRKSSKRQKGFFNIIIGEIAKETGADPDIIKEGIKQKYYPKISYRNIIVIKPTVLLTVPEMNKAINGAILEAAEQGIEIQDYKQEWENWQMNQMEGEKKNDIY